MGESSIKINTVRRQKHVFDLQRKLMAAYLLCYRFGSLKLCREILRVQIKYSEMRLK